MTGIPILMYHALEDSGHPTGYNNPSDQVYTLDSVTFESHLKYLQNHGYRTILFKDLEKISRISERTVMLTFDDGHASNHEITLPLLLTYGFRAEFFVTTRWIGEPFHLSHDQILKLDEFGMGVGSHGETHALLDDLPVENAKRELAESKKRLEQIIGKKIQTLSLPGGRRPASGADPAALGYEWVCSSRVGLFDGQCNWNIPRMAIRRDTTLHTFINIVERNPVFYKRANLKSKVLGIAKGMLGNHLYSKAHRALAARKF